MTALLSRRGHDLLRSRQLAVILSSQPGRVDHRYLEDQL